MYVYSIVCFYSIPRGLKEFSETRYVTLVECKVGSVTKFPFNTSSYLCTVDFVIDTDEARVLMLT